MSLLRMSLTAGIMILAVAAVRLLFGRRLPKKTFLVLWALVLCRLLIPFELPSPASVYTTVPQAVETVRRTTAAIQTGLPPDLLPQAVTFEPVYVTVGSTAVLPLLWAAGGVLLALFFASAYLRARFLFREALPMEGEEVAGWLAEQRLRRALRVLQTDRVDAPLTYGILRPVILLPSRTDWSDGGALRYILAHELVHVKRFDAVWKLLLTAALCLHWWNPGVWLMYFFAGRDLELSCDEEVVKLLGSDSRSDYARTLLGMGARRGGLLPMSNAFSKTAIEERVNAIMKFKKTSLLAILAAAVVVVTVAVCFATSAEKRSGLRDGDPDVSAVIDQAWQESIAPYTGLGVTYDPGTQAIYYRGKPVRELWDNVTGTLITDHGGVDFPPDAIDLTIVYEDGMMSGIRVVPAEEFEENTRRRLADADNIPLGIAPPNTSPGEDRLSAPSTDGDYKALLGLMDGAYGEQSVQRFNALLLRRMEEPSFLASFQAVMEDLSRGEGEYVLTPEQTDFLAVTLTASYCENRAAQAGVSTEYPFSHRQSFPGTDISLECPLTYRIPDPGETTVSARDMTLQSLLRDIRAWAGHRTAYTFLKLGGDGILTQLNRYAQAYTVLQFEPIEKDDLYYDAVEIVFDPVESPAAVADLADQYLLRLTSGDMAAAQALRYYDPDGPNVEERRGAFLESTPPKSATVEGVLPLNDSLWQINVKYDDGDLGIQYVSNYVGYIGGRYYFILSTRDIPEDLRPEGLMAAPVIE